MRTPTDKKDASAASAAWDPTFLVAMVAGMAALAVSASLYFYEAGQIESGWREREAIQVRMFTEIFGRSFQSVSNDTLALASGDGFQAYLSNRDPADLERAFRRAEFFSHAKHAFDQVRYIDESGREIIRVNRNGVRAAPATLKTQADRGYFRAAMTLAVGQIYISALDLNEEDGKIEEPFKPTMRFATPVFDSDGHRRGVYVINYLASVPFSRLQELDLSASHSARVINAGGYWLMAGDPAKEWGFALPGRGGETLASSEPALWTMIASNPVGQVARNGGLLTWRRIVPSEVVLGEGAAPTIAADPFLVVASEISGAEWAAAFRGLRETFWILTVIIVLLVAVTAWFLRARQKARAEQDRFFSLSLDLLCISSSDGYFKRVSNAVTDILGWSVKEFLARPYIDFVHPDDVEATLREVQKQVVAGEKVLHFENRYLTKDASWRVLSWRSIPYPGGLMYATARDVTDLRRSDDQIQKLNSDLKKRAAQLESANGELESFSYSVSHDLRAPLRHIDGFVGLLVKSDGGAVSDAGRGYLDRISGAAKRMGVLIDDLLAFSRMGRSAMNVAAIDMDRLVADVLSDLRVDTEGRNIHWTIGPLPAVVGDRAMIRQVFVNLVRNAVKYSGKRDPAKIEIGTQGGADNEAVFFVRDNGVGFPMEYVHKLFGVFQRLHGVDEFEGTGIGLANVRRIVTRHGGRTWAEGKPDAGATFYFSLPRVQEEGNA